MRLVCASDTSFENEAYILRFPQQNSTAWSWTIIR